MIITCLKWLFNYDFWIRVTVYAEEHPQTSQQVDIWGHSPLLGSLAEALSKYYNFPEPNLKDYQLHIFGELVDYFDSKYPQKNNMAATHLAYTDLALDKFSGTDPDRDAESFMQLLERKSNFALGDAPANPDELANYSFRKKALFSSLLRGSAAEWYESNVEAATPWNDIRTGFVARFSDGRNKFRHRMEVEQCVRRDGEEIRNFLHRIKRTVDKGWPDDMNGIVGPQQAAERDAEARQRRQRCIDYSLRGLRPNYLRRKAQEYLMEHPNATWNDYSAHIVQRDVPFQVSSNFLNDEEQTKAKLALLGKEMKNLRTEFQEHRVNAIEGTSKPVHPNQKGRQNATRFCGYCRTNGNTPSWCRKKIRDEQLKRIENERTAEKKVTFTQDYNKKRGPSHGSGQWKNTRNFTDRANHFMVKVTRIVGDLLSETNSLTEMVEAGKEVTNPTHKTETGTEIGSSLALHKSREETLPIQLRVPATTHPSQSR